MVKNCQRFDAVNARQKNPSSLQSTISEKIKKAGPKLQILIKLLFMAVFLDFPETVLCRELRFFALHSVYQNPFFELSKIKNQQSDNFSDFSP